jgi:hypothetical protein
LKRIGCGRFLDGDALRPDTHCQAEFLRRGRKVAVNFSRQGKTASH